MNNTIKSIYNKRVKLIKRPPLYRSISPTLETTKKKKSVQFHNNTSLENVRLFLKSQMPKACQSDPHYKSKKYIFKLKKPYFNNESNLGVKFEDVNLFQANHDLALVGTAKVANLAFEKKVQVIYTFDDWNHIKRVDAVYLEPIKNSGNTWDRFQFKIDLNHVDYHQKIQLAISYSVNNHEFWDNNQSKNYEFHIISNIQLYQHNNSSLSSVEAYDEDEDDDYYDQESDVDDSYPASITLPASPPLTPPSSLDSGYLAPYCK